MKHKIIFSIILVLASLSPAWSQLTTMHATLSGIGIKSVNGLTAKTQTFATGSTGTDFNISSSGTVHTFNIPTASATNRGLLSSADWIAFNSHFTLPAFTAGSVIFSNGTTLVQDNPNFYWHDANNRLGIGGTTDPATELQVVSTSAAEPRGILTSQFSSNALGSRLHFRKSRGTVSSPTIIVTGDTLGAMRFSGYDGTNNIQMGGIDVVSSGTVAATRVPTYMVFSTATNTTPSVLTERMRINSEGNVGIGSISISSKLTVGSDSGYAGNFAVAPAAKTAQIGYFEFVTNGSTGYFGQGISCAGANRMTEHIGSNIITSDDYVFKFRSGTTMFANPTSGTKTFFEIGGGSTAFTPTSGTAVYNTLSIVGTINQTGGSSGITRGAYFNQTLTAAADYRAIEVAVGRSVFSARVSLGKGADVASANDLTLGAGGNCFHITGTTTINAITTTNWSSGSHIVLIFDAATTVKNNTAGGANTAVMLLSGGADFTTSANDTLKLIYDGTSWFELSRSIN